MPDAKAVLNSRVKHREEFRPFAPVVLLDEAAHWFEADGHGLASPFMLRVCRFRKEKQPLVPGVVHVDGTGQIQTVTPEENGLFYQLIRKFHERTGVPILNTSYNAMDEPIVETPDDALWCFMSTGIDACVLEGRVVTKKPGFRSILDFYPCLTGSSTRDALAVGRGRSRSSPSPPRRPGGARGRSRAPMSCRSWRSSTAEPTAGA